MGRKKNPDKALNRKKSQEEYRHKVRRFTFQFSLHDAESREWFEHQQDKGAYLKQLILTDKQQTMAQYLKSRRDSTMSVNAFTEEYEYIELFGKPGLFTNARIDRDTVPEGWYAYDLRGSDYDPGEPMTVEPNVVVNHAGTILTHEPISFPKEGFKRLNGQLEFADAYHLSLQEFCEERGLNYPENNRKFILRPASPDEAGLFYSQEEQDAELATVGHMRFDHGSGGNEFWTTWWEHNGNALNTPEFKAELQSVVDELRRGPLKDRSTMSSYCHSHAGELDAGAEGSYGYVAETENYRYCLRCSPQKGDYSYIYIYDKRQQEQNMAQEPPVIGTVSFASGETLAYTDPAIFLQVVRDELPYKPTSGFQYQVLTDEPTVRKGADDILYDLFGEKNPRPLEDYGLTKQGQKALRNAENPNLPHSYRWFVVENFNCDGEVRHDTDSLTGAIDRFNSLACDSKRLSVTKDDVSTVYLAIAENGETHLDEGWHSNPRFADDSVIQEAAERLKLGIAGLEPSGPTMNFGGM